MVFRSEAASSTGGKFPFSHQDFNREVAWICLLAPGSGSTRWPAWHPHVPCSLHQPWVTAPASVHPEGATEELKGLQSVAREAYSVLGFWSEGCQKKI